MSGNIVGKFARVTSDKYGEYGLAEGALVFISGSGFAPVDADDNYKLLFVVLAVKDDVPQGDHGITIARTSLEVASDEEDADLKSKMEVALVKQAEAANDSAE